MIDWYLLRVERLLSYCDIDIAPRKFLFFNAWFTLIGSLFPALLFHEDLGLAVSAFLAGFIALNIAIFGFLELVKDRRAESAEETLPDYLLLFSNNVKAGFTPEQAMLVSAKKEIGLLSVEVSRAVSQSASGRPVEEVLPRISDRLDSNVVRNTFSLIVEGMLSGGDLSKLLERTSYDLRRFEAVRKDIRSTVMVYELFISSAACIAAPLLLGTSLFIVKVVMSIRSKINPSALALGSTFSFTPSEVMLDDTTLLIFGFGAIFIITAFASLAVGLISKGKQSDGLKYFPVLFTVGAAVFMLVRGMLELWLGRIFMLAG